jgi:hypothetical protein
VLVDGDLFGGIVGLGSEVLMVIKEGLILGVEFEALILKVIPLLEDGLELDCESVVDELILNGRLQLFEQLDELVDFDLVALDKLLLMADNGLLEALVHVLRGLLDTAQQTLDQVLRLLHRIE